MSFEILEPGFYDRGLMIVSQKRQSAIAEFKFLHNQVKIDPNATVVGWGRLRKPSIFVVPYWYDSDVRLKSTTFNMPEDEEIYIELGVVEPDGEMSITTSETNLSYINLEVDPFSQLILDYFRKQYL